jgi:hypothetical protein
MSTHARHIRAPKVDQGGHIETATKAQVKFHRYDLLFRTSDELVDPNTGEVIAGLPLPIRRIARDPKTGAVVSLGNTPVGPTILDMMERLVSEVKDLPPRLRDQALDDLMRKAEKAKAKEIEETDRFNEKTRQKAEEQGLPVPEPVVVDPLDSEKLRRQHENTPVAWWRVRDLATIWRDPNKARKRKEVDAKPKEPEHPFDVALVSGGGPKPLPGSVPGIQGVVGQGGWRERIEEALGPYAEDFLTVRKPSTVSISTYAFRLAYAVQGGVGGAYDWIGREGDQEWLADLERSAKIWRLLRDAGGVMLESEEVIKLRPKASISQSVEQTILSEACVFLGVDPDEDLSRPRGRPAPETKFVKVWLDKDEQGERALRGEWKADFGPFAKGQSFSDCAIVDLVLQGLGPLRQAGDNVDADHLQSWLDATGIDWREEAVRAAEADEAAGEQGGAAPGAGMTPYEVLGLPEGAPWPEVQARWHTIVKTLRPDLATGMPTWLFQTVKDAYSTLKAAYQAQRRAERGEADTAPNDTEQTVDEGEAV